MSYRPKGCQSKIMTADGAVTTEPYNVYALVIATKGATAGDIVALRDGSITGTVKVRAVVEVANGTQTIQFGRYGISFSGPIYYAHTVAAVDTVWSTVVYDR